MIGASGSGKSYAVGVICEELCRAGVPFAVVDTEGEYSGLKGKYEVIRVNDDDGMDVAWEGLDLEDLARQAPEIAPIILDISDVDDPKRKVNLFLSSLYKVISERRTPYLVVVEEADRFIPQSGERLPVFGELARRGRKRGLGLMVCTQRPSLVDKNVLSQCGNQLIGKLVIRNDLEAVSQFFPGNSLPKQLTTLGPGEFYALGGLASEPTMVAFRKRETRHGGFTPALVKRVVRPYEPSHIVSEGPQRSPSSSKGPLGLSPSLSADGIPLLVRRQKQYLFFGREETLTSVKLEYRELLELAVRLRTGVLRKKYETKYALIDGTGARFIVLRGGITLKEGLGRYLGLKERQLELLWQLRSDKELSSLELASKTGVRKATIRTLMKPLEERRLARASEIGRTTVYRRLVERPEPDWGVAPLDLESLDIGSARIMPSSVNEAELREVVRSTWENSELESSTPFLYPIYRVDLATKRKRRTIWIDGRTGRNLER